MCCQTSSRFTVSLLACLLCLGAATAHATNGMNPIAFGARSAGMGGADIAMARDIAAMNTNPGGITRVSEVGVSLSLLMPSMTLDDEVTTPQGTMTLNDGLEGESQRFPLVNAGFALNVWDNLSVGLALVAQGGMGVEFKGVSTMVDDDPQQPIASQPTPAQYGIDSQVAYMKLTPTIAYKLADLGGMMDLSVGVAANVGFAQMRFNHSGFQFPEMDGDHVYTAHEVDFESDWATGYAIRVGLLAEFLEGDLAVGLSYQTQADITFEGTSTFDGGLEYDSEVDFAWPQEIGLGLAGKPIDPLTLAIDVRWINWAETMDTVTITGKAKGQAPPGYEAQHMPFQLKWDDQLVVAVGAQYQIIDILAVRMGYNWGKSPVTEAGINPIFPAVAVHHVTGGLSVEIIEGLRADVALEVALENSVKSNADNQLAHEPMPPPAEGGPNGYAIEVAMSQLTGHVAMTYAF